MHACQPCNATQVMPASSGTISTRASVLVYSNVCAHASTRTRTHTPAHTHTRSHTRTHTHNTHMHTHTHTHTHTRARALQVMLATYERRRSQREVINEMPLYPTEGVLWDENQIPSVNYTGGCWAEGVRVGVRQRGVAPCGRGYLKGVTITLWELECQPRPSRSTPSPSAGEPAHMCTHARHHPQSLTQAVPPRCLHVVFATFTLSSPCLHTTGEGCLALPKLNLQFLTPHDYLLRNFNLFR